MSNYQKPVNDIGAAWERQGKKGDTFLSLQIDCSHSPDTALALANMLLSGQPIQCLASLNKKFDGTGSKIPKYSLYIPQQQHNWMNQVYNRAYQKNEAPVYDFRTGGSRQQTPTPYPPQQVQQNAYPPQQQGIPHAMQAPVQQLQQSAPQQVGQDNQPQQPSNPFGA